MSHAESRSLRDAANSTDYLVIAPAEFIPDIEPYLRWRSSTTSTHKGLRTFVVSLSDINKEFLDTTKPQAQAEAIHAFISHALQSWQSPKLRYVLLVGSTSVLPAYRIKVTDFTFSQPPYIWYEDSIPMDNWYVVNRHIQSFNNRPQASIGRIPGRNAEEIRRTLQKIRTFEEYGNWMNYNTSARFTSLMDADDASMFEDWRFSLFDFLQAKTRQTIGNETFAYAKVLNTPRAKQATFEAINAGSPCLLYFGHGAPNEWSRYRIITTDDVWNSFSRAGRPFMFASLGCSQNYDIPSKLSIVESMLLLENGGAVMSLASSGYSDGRNGRFYLTEFFSQLFLNPGMDLGTAISLANDRVFEQRPLIDQDDLYRRFALLGDPAMVPFPRFLTSVREQSSDVAPSSSALALGITPNPASDGAATLNYTLPEATTVRFEIFSLTGERVFAESITQPAGSHRLQLNTQFFSSGVYICRISTQGKNMLTAGSVLRVIR